MSKKIEKEEQTRQRILDGSLREFFRFGYSKVSMDEIARSMAMSKKTIYKHFDSKEEILLEAIQNRQCNVINSLEKILENSDEPFFQRLVKTGHIISRVIANTPLTFMADLQRSSPAIYRQIKGFRREQTSANFEKFMKQGVDAGVIREDIPLGLVSLVYVTLIDTLITPEMLLMQGSKPEEMYENIVKLIFEGIVIEKHRESYRSIVESQDLEIESEINLENDLCINP